MAPSAHNDGIAQPRFTKVRVERSEREPFILPSNPFATIWRYLDFTKFVALLDTQELFFAPSAAFEDRFEGSYSSANIDGRKEFWARSHEVDDPEGMAASHAELARELPRWVFANCWSLSEIESAAFWSRYVPASGAVAVRSTVFDLTECFHSPDPADERSDPLYIGRVDYLNYDKDLIPEHDLLYPFVHKRRSFEFESELRAVITHFPEGEDPDGGVTAEELREATPVDGLTVAVDVGQLIQAIHVSPTAPDWFFELVSSVVERYEISAQVVRSSLAEEPLF
jgi:hypothetical protein